MRIILSILCFIAALWAANFNEQFSSFDRDFKAANTAQKTEFLNELQGIFLSSILNGDDELKLEVLPRLITASKVLKKDFVPYQNELNALKKRISPTPSPLKKNEPKSEAKNSVKNKIEAKKELNPPKITKINASKSDLTLILSHDISNIKEFNLNTKTQFRSVFDLDAELALPSYKNQNSISRSVRVAQFDKNTVRVVFEDSKSQKIKYAINGNKIVFSANGVSVNGVKSASKSSEKNSDKSTKPATNKTAKKPIYKSKIIVLDPGHGGKDAGAVNGKLYEKNIVLNIALKTGKILQKRGYKVFYTRSNDKFIKLRNRTSLANDKNADLFISLHANAAPNKSKALSAQGIETYFLSPTRSERSMSAANLENRADTDEMNYFTKLSFLNFLNREKIIASNKLAIDIQSSLLAGAKPKFKSIDGGVRDGPFWVLVGALMPAVLIEVGYISHPVESKRIATEAYANVMAEGIADGVEKYFAKNN